MHTGLRELLNIDVPIVLAPFGPWDQVELAAAVCEAGALGSVGHGGALGPGAARRSGDGSVSSPTGRSPSTTPVDRSTPRPSRRRSSSRRRRSPSTWAFPPTSSPRRTSAASSGCRRSATSTAPSAAIDAGADVLVAQGTEAGGNAGWVTTMVLVPAVVDVAGEVPVVAAGGIADGRGIAAALALGAQGVCLGTRFLATTEMSIDTAWKERIVAASALDAVKVPHAERVMPPFTLPRSARPSLPRALRTAAHRPTRGRARPASTRPRSGRSCWPPCGPVEATSSCPSPDSPPARARHRTGRRAHRPPRRRRRHGTSRWADREVDGLAHGSRRSTMRA